MKVALVYTSLSGNTRRLTQHIVSAFEDQGVKVDIYTSRESQEIDFLLYDVLLIGTYTWGNGEIPKQMMRIYKRIEDESSEHLITGIYGTGDRFYPYFCGAVNEFRDMLAHHTQLAVTLKVEALPQESDIEKTKKFFSLIMKKYDNMDKLIEREDSHG